jgi:hypothetical protein
MFHVWSALLQHENPEDMRKYAAEQGISETAALEKGLKEKSAEFVEKGTEVYAKRRKLSP